MRRILVVEDHEVIRDLMVTILERGGYEAVGVESAERGLQLLEDFSLVVSDIVLPGLSGLELLDQVRARRPSMPVVLVTGADMYAQLGEAVARGADGFVMKPFAHADLRRAVARALERARQPASALRPA
jgi:CheY-like chemotaxis protein